jgi:tetratricopeptide (TPR) repeat protein/glycosyltransferase involved in cell wall biosynthesis
MNASAQHQLAQQYLNQGQVAEAIAMVKQLLANDPEDAIGHYLQAQVCLAQGQTAQAQIHLERAIQQQPTYIEALLKLGNVHFMQQNFAAAIANYAQVSALQANQVEAFYYAGLAHRQLGQNNQAIANYQQALHLASDRADIWTALGNVYFASQTYDQAAHCYRQAIAADPNHAHAYNGLGGVLGQQGDTAAAIANFRQAIATDPKHLDALSNLGMALLRQEQYAQALDYFKRAATINPKLASLQRSMGLILYKQEQFKAAIDKYHQAIALDPKFVDAYVSLGVALIAARQPAAAIAAYQKATELAPTHAEANYNLGVASAQQNQLTEAVLAYCRAIAARPNYADAYNGLGASLLQQNNLSGAINAYEKALEIDPAHQGANFGLGVTYLTQGDFAAGLPGYEYRFALQTITSPKYQQPVWDGSNDTHDHTILLWIEQGLGDAIQFIRYVPIVAERFKQVIVKCRQNLVPLFAMSPAIAAVATVIGDRDPLPAFDLHASLLSLPNLLGTTLATIPNQVPYLSVDRQKLQQRSLPAEPKFKIGIVWASGFFTQNPNAAKQYNLRSISLLLWTSLLTIPGTRFYSLQLGQDQQEIGWLDLKNYVIDLSDRIDDFADTAALIEQMDLVISVDTAVAHLAGAIGKQTWVLLPFAPDWRWLIEREDSPWYPTMRLFRQINSGEPYDLSKPNDSQPWQQVMNQVRDELISLVKTTDLAKAQPLATALAQFAPVPAPNNLTLAGYWQKLATKLSTQQNYAEAQFYYQRVLALQPDHAEVANKLGYTCWRLQKYADADIYLDRAIALKPDYAEAFNHKGIVAWSKQAYGAAIAHYQQAIAIDPDYAMAHSNLGVVLSHQKKYAQAEVHYRRAIAINPNYTQAYNNLGIVLYEQDQSTEAIAYYRKALALNPNYHQALSNCGAALVAEGQIDPAIVLYHRAIELNPSYPEVQNNMGMALLEQGKVTAGLPYFRKAIELNPNYVDAHTNLAMGLLTLGEFGSGFETYEWRRDSRTFHKRNFAQPLWDGQPFPGKTLLIRTEQGLGDTIQFIRYVAQVKQLGDRVVVEGNHKALQPILKTIDSIDQVITKGEPLPKFDLHISLLSLPRLFKTSLTNIPDRVPYLQINQPFSLELAESSTPDVVDLTTQPKLKVGIVWRSDSKNKTKQKRSCPLAIFQQILQIPQIEFYSLQKEIQPEDAELLGIELDRDHEIDRPSANQESTNQAAAQNTHQSVTILANQLNSLNDTAAAIAQLDLVISIDTMVAHLAGALAKPVWVLLPLASDWRWLLDRADSVWYPTARLFRQSQLDDWQSVITKVCAALIEVSGDRSLLKSLESSPDNISSSPKLQSQTSQPDRVLKSSNASTFAPIKPDEKMPAILAPMAPISTRSSLTIPKSLAPNSSPNQTTPASIAQNSSAPQSKQSIGIGWSIGANTGWGTFGLNLALQLLRHETFAPFLIAPPAIDPSQANPLHLHLLAQTFAQRQQLQQALNNNPQSAFGLNIPIIHALGNHFGGSQLAQIKGSQNIGFIFFEDTELDRQALDRARAFDLILAGSSWNTEILRNYGLEHVDTVLQGIDPTAYYPSPKAKLFGDRFVIFSGGKLEYRKAQDIVIAAYKIFQAQHPDALLITAWHNPWTQFMQGLEQTGNVTALPLVDAQGKLQIEPWLVQNGLPIDSFMALDAIPRHQVPQIIRAADVAVFPNRAEGGTNLVAMECMACGIPCIISANTGHLDLIDEKHCYPLSTQRSLLHPPAYLKGTDGWGESTVEEVVAHLETVYHHRQAAINKGKAAAQFMLGLTWENQVDRLVKLVQASIPANT